MLTFQSLATMGMTMIVTRKAEAGRSSRPQPQPGSGTWYGRCRFGALYRKYTNAANSTSSARQYTMFMRSTICKTLPSLVDHTDYH